MNFDQPETAQRYGRSQQSASAFVTSASADDPLFRWSICIRYIEVIEAELLPREDVPTREECHARVVGCP